MADYLSKSWNGFPVFYTRDLDGGGTIHADDFLALLTQHVQPRRFAKAFEWCSGPGFVGYALLASGVCNSLCLADFYGPAVTAARHTAKTNHVEDRVTVYQGDNLSALPAHESFDLVLGNPPHFQNRNMSEFSCDNDPRIYVDEHWNVHRKFFSTVRRHLTRDGLVVLSENTWGSHLETFRDMIESAGLAIAGWRWSINHGQTLWYMFVTRDDATVRYEFGN
jgi:methylase of polypeptide subunit release factors